VSYALFRKSQHHSSKFQFVVGHCDRLARARMIEERALDLEQQPRRHLRNRGNLGAQVGIRKLFAKANLPQLSEPLNELTADAIATAAIRPKVRETERRIAKQLGLLHVRARDADVEERDLQLSAVPQRERPSLLERQAAVQDRLDLGRTDESLAWKPRPRNARCRRNTLASRLVVCTRIDMALAATDQGEHDDCTKLNLLHRSPPSACRAPHPSRRESRSAGTGQERATC
jgi:hypothetical protein